MARIAPLYPASLRSLAVLMLLSSAVRAETLPDAIAIAVAHNPTLVQQRYRQKATDEGYVQARAQYGPQLEVQAAGNYESSRSRGQTNSGDTRQVVATLNQPLYTFGQLRGQLLAAKANVLAGQQDLRSVEQQTLQNVIIVYAGVLRDQQRLEVARQNVLVLQDQLRENRERYRLPGRGRGAGEVTLTDVGLADSRLASAEITLAQIQSALEVSRSEYVEVVGQNPGTLQPLPDLLGMPGSVDAAFALAEANNPSLLSAKYVEQSSSATAAGARGQFGPRVSLTAQGIYQNELLPLSGRLGTKEVVAGVTITQPLFSSGLLRSRVREADARNGADQAAVEGARRSAIAAVSQAWSQLASARSSLVSGARQVQSAQLSFAGMRREELYGLRSTLDTLNVEQELLSAQLNFLQNQYTEYVARAALLAAVGGLKVETISPDAPTYDPTDNFNRVRHTGETPLEWLARAADRIGSADPRRPAIVDLKGEESPVPDAMPTMPPTLGADITQRRLTPISESPLVPASALPGGLPVTGDVPSTPPALPVAGGKLH